MTSPTSFPNKLRSFASGRALPLFLLIAGSLVFFIQGARGILDEDSNDYAVFHWGAVEAWNQSELLYRRPSNKEDRHYLYPPSGACAMIPLGWLPLRVSGLLFNAARLAALAWVLWTILEWRQREEGRRAIAWDKAALWIAFGAILLNARYLQSEFRNGQVNLVLLAMALGGARWSFRDSPGWQWAGGCLIGFAAGVKGMPFLLAGVPLLYGRWRAVTGAFAMALALGALSVWWLGPENAEMHWILWKERSERSASMRWEKDVIVSLPELVVSSAFGAGRWIAPEDTGRWWLMEAAIMAALYLSLREVRKRTGHGVSPAWDAALAALAMVLLGPVTRKAHVVFALPALALWLWLSFGKGFRAASGKAKAGLALLALLFLGGRSVALDRLFPGVDANPAPLLACAAAGAFLALTPLPKPTEVSEEFKKSTLQT
jgi:hypothetical protein